MRRGTIFDLPIISASILISGMFIFIAMQISVSLEDQPGLNQSIIEQGKIGVVNTGISFPFWSIGMGLVSVILAFKFGGSPVLVVFSILFMGFAIMINAMLANAFEVFMDGFASSVISQLGPVIFIQQYLPLYALAIGSLIIVAYHSGRSRDMV